MQTSADVTKPAEVRSPAAMLAVAVMYFLTARIGLLLAIPGGHVTPVWPPSGIALAAVLIMGRRVWPGIWLGSFAANLWDFIGETMGLPTAIGSAAILGVGASLGALLGEQLIRRFIGEQSPFGRVSDVCTFLLLGGLVSCLFAATVGVTTLCLAECAPWSDFGNFWLTWWLGDVAGVFVVTPLILTWWRSEESGGRSEASPGRPLLEAAICLTLLVGVTAFVFIGKTPQFFHGRPLTFLLVPFLVWPTVRFGPRGATGAVALIAMLAVWGTAHGAGPFNGGPPDESLLVLELFLSVLVLTALCLGAVTTGRERALAAQRLTLAEMDGRVRAATAEFMAANLALKSEVAERERAQEDAVRLVAETARGSSALLSLYEDQRLAEVALRRSESRLRAILNAEPECVKLLDAEGRLMEMNAAGLRMIQADSLESVAGHCVFPLVVPEFRERFREFTKTVCGGTRANIEFEIIGLKGTRIWMESHAVPFHDEATGETRLLSITQDISERKRSETSLRESETRFRSLFEQAAVGVARVAPNGRWLDVNQRLSEIVGYTREELLTLAFQDITHPEDIDADLDYVRRMLADEIRSYTMEKRYVRKDRSMVWINLTVSLVREPSGAPLYFISVVEDISGRKATNAALRLAEEKFRSIFENAIEGIFQSTPEGRYLTVNPAFARILGYDSPEELIRECRDIARQIYVNPADREKFTGLLAEHCQVAGFEHEARRKDGSTVWVSLNARVIRDAGGGLQMYEGSIEDISRRKKSEAALRNLSRRVLKAEDDERRRIAKELHDSTAQDLVAVMLNLGMLEEELAEPHPKALEILADSAALIERSTTDIRTLAYLLHPPRLDELGLVGGLTEYAAGLSNRSDVRIRVDVPTDFGRLSEDVEIALFRVAQESLANVLRHSGSDAATIRLKRENGKVMLEVEDYGRGIPAGLASQPGARGVGIAGTRERLQHFGGVLEIDSTERGTTIRAVVPLEERKT